MSAPATMSPDSGESQKSDFRLTIAGFRTEDSAELPCPTRLATLDRLVRTHRPLLRKLCASYARRAEDAEDLEAATVLVACRRFSTYDPARGAFGTWLGAILRNEAADMRRRAARQPVCLPNDQHTESLLEAAAARTVDPVVGGTCDAEPELTPLLRRAFELVKLQGLTCAEAGRLMGKTEGTVRTYVWRARRILRSRSDAA